MQAQDNIKTETNLTQDAAATGIFPGSPVFDAPESPFARILGQAVSEFVANSFPKEVDETDARMSGKEYYSSSMQHILAELERIDLLVRVQAVLFADMAAEPEHLKGLVITPEKIEAMAHEPICMPRWMKVEDRVLVREVRDKVADMGMEIAERKAGSKMRNIRLRLAELSTTFDLSPLDTDILLMAFAPELDLRYEQFYAYLHDNVTRKSPSVDLAVNLFAFDFEESIRIRSRFADSAPLIKNRLVSLESREPKTDSSFLMRMVRIDERISGYLVDSHEPDKLISSHVKMIRPEKGLDDMILPADFKEKLATFATTLFEEKSVFYFQGPYGSGKQDVAEGICRRNRADLMRVDGKRLAGTDIKDFISILKLMVREAKLSDATIYWAGFDALLTGDKEYFLAEFLREMECFSNTVFLSGDVTWEPKPALRGMKFIRIEFPATTCGLREKLWKDALGDGPVKYNDTDLKELASKFLFTAGRIKDAASTAKNLAVRRNPADVVVESGDLYAAARLQSNGKLEELAQKITPLYKWSDIVLPEYQMEQLKNICNHIKYRSVVYEKWGFDKKMSLGKGLNVVYSGESGTGKTMSAEILANELGLDLYKIDLSMVVSKYIGETEKNISGIFEEAKNSNAILFFDEADAIFGKRSEVKDAHDRYANIETSYLLQKMEEHLGMVILATNFSQNMDTAFLRRIHFTVEFPFPQKEDRLRIWRKMLPEQAPCADDIDFELMADKFEIAGGNIRNVVLGAAFLAAGEEKKINMDYLFKSTKNEFRKMGRFLMDDWKE